MSANRRSLSGLAGPRRSKPRMDEKTVPTNPSDSFQALYNRVEAILSEGNLPISRIDRIMKLGNDPLARLQSQVRDAFDDASDCLEATDHTTPYLVKLLAELRKDIDGLEKTKNPMGWLDLLNCLLRFSGMSVPAGEAQTDIATGFFSDSDLDIAGSRSPVSPLSRHTSPAKQRSLRSGRHSGQPTIAIGTRLSRSTTPLNVVDRQTNHAALLNQQLESAVSTTAVSSSSSTSAGIYSTILSSPKTEYHASRPAFYSEYVPGQTAAEYAASTARTRTSRFAVEQNSLRVGDDALARRRMSLKSRPGGVVCVSTRNNKCKRTAADAALTQSPIPRSKRLSTISQVERASKESLEFGHATTKKQLLGSVWNILISLVGQMSAKLRSEQLNFAHKNLETLLVSYKEHAVLFADEDWSKELVRLIKDAIRECIVGDHGLGKYAIFKLRDTAMNWYKAELDTETNDFEHGEREVAEEGSDERMVDAYPNSEVGLS